MTIARREGIAWARLADVDPELWAAIRGETDRQRWTFGGKGRDVDPRDHRRGRLALGGRPVAVSHQLEEVRDVAVHHLRLAYVLRPAVCVYVLARLQSGLAQALPLLAEHYLLQRDD